MLLLEKKRKTEKNGGETKKPRRKIGILLKSNHTYMSLLQMNQRNYTRKTKETLFEIR